VKAVAAVLVLALAWVSGLFAFAGRVQRMTPAPMPLPADGIVSLTGGSDVRLKTGTDLLEAGEGRRLLVSGVNPMATRQDVWTVTGAAKPLFDCCVDLGFKAADTVAALSQPHSGHRRLPHAPSHGGARGRRAGYKDHTLSGGDDGSRRPPVA
jgi:hypothetical protein